MKPYAFAALALFFAASNAYSGNNLSTSEPTAWDKTKAVSSDVWDGTKDVASDVWDGATEVSSDVWDGAKQVGSDIKDGISGDEKSSPKTTTN
ncbi:MAG: hypothetical protein J5895_00895 [Alphaproteobacteria bacterium]|nr:hypothetical protein [Alphaproteobacteria bacterium]